MTTVYTLVNQGNGGYLDADEPALRDGAKTQTWGSSGSGKPNQQWVMKPDPNQSNVYTIVNVKNNGYLDIDVNATTRDGAKVQTWGSSGSGKPNQQWRLNKVQGNIYNLISVSNGGYLDADDSKSSPGRDGEKVQTWGSSGSGKPNQQWLLTSYPLQVDLVVVLTAFAVNFPGKVKNYTLGDPPDPIKGRGLRFLTDRIIDAKDKNSNPKLWIYWAYPKPVSTTYPNGYQSVWDGYVLEEDDYISADCTIPFSQGGSVWVPPIPRFYETVATLPGDLGLIPIAEALKSATSRTGGKSNVIARGPEPCSPGISRAGSRIGPGSLATVSILSVFVVLWCSEFENGVGLEHSDRLSRQPHLPDA